MLLDYIWWLAGKFKQPHYKSYFLKSQATFKKSTVFTCHLTRGAIILNFSYNTEV